MANSLEFKISADDQASRTVETVQNKIQNFGRDIAKMALGFAGPLALVQMGFSKIGEMMEEQKRKREELSQSVISDPLYQQIVAQKQYQTTLTETERLILAQKEAQDALTKTLEMDSDKRRKYTEDYLKTEAGKKVVSQSVAPGSEAMPITDAYITMLSSIKKYQDIALEAQKTEAEKLKIQLESSKILKEQMAFEEQTAKIRAQPNLVEKLISDQRKSDIKTYKDLLVEIYKQEDAAKRLLNIEKEKRGITVSSLREMGGGVYGESAAIQAQTQENSPMVGALNAQLDALRSSRESTQKQINALEKNTSAIEALKMNGGNINSDFSGRSPLENTF